MTSKYESVVTIEFPDENYTRGDKTFPDWHQTVLRDENGNVKAGVREFTLRMNSDGLGQVDTIELVNADGAPLTDGAVVVNEDGSLAEACFSYLLAGVQIRS